MQRKDIKIFISCFQNRVLIPENDMFVPVLAGAANAPERFSGMAYDDVGDNISKKNARFNDATTQYWAWKNQDCDYYGFFQYRRFLSFDTDLLPAKQFEKIYYTNDKEAYHAMRLDDEKHMRNIIEQYDVITCNPLDYDEYKYTLYEQFRDGENQHIEDLDTVLDIIERKYPDYMEAAQDSLFGGKGYFAHCFIMKKEIFHAYCAWMFDILQEFDDNKDYSDYSGIEQRVVGYLSERLLGIYYAYLRKNSDCKFFELQKCFFQTTRELPIDPAFGEDAISVLLSTNNDFLPYTSTLVQSIVDNASSARKYDIVVLHDGIKNYAIKRFCAAGRDNVSIRFVNVASYVTGKDVAIRGHFRRETFFRFALADVMANYKKVLLLDSDMVVKTDIAALYDTDLDRFAVAAVQDADTAGNYNGYDPLRKRFADRALKFKDPYDYFQAGVMLVDVNKFSRLTDRESLTKLAQSRNWDLLDQDILNLVLHGHVQYLDMAWNVLHDWKGIRAKEIIGKAPKPLQDQYQKARLAPRIIHYAGPQKPWNDPDCDMQEDFWHYAARCPLYSDIQTRLALRRRFDEGSKKSKKQEGIAAAKNLANAVLPKGSRRRTAARKLVGKNFEFTKDARASQVIDSILEDTLIVGCNLKPAFGGNSVPIALTSSEYFSIYMGVTIQSILDNASDDVNYDILILHQEISKVNRKLLLSLAEGRPNVSIRFVNIKFALINVTMEFAAQFSKEIFCRPLLDKILNHYDKVIFVDSDMVVNADLKELNDIDLGTNLIAAVRDACFSVFYDYPDPKIEASYDIKDYLDDINLDNPKDVFNAGLTVINLAQFRKTFATSMVLGLANVRPLPYADQDVLNIMCHNRVHFLPHTWNYRVDVLVNNINLRALTSQYSRLRDSYKIAHYAGSAKPWNTPNLPTEEAFWHYARRSPFYSAIIKRMLWEQSANISYSMIGLQPKKSRKLLEKLLPNGTGLRKLMEKLFPLGSFQRIAVKKVINFIFRS